MSSESAWVALRPSHHFVRTETRARRCAMCKAIIPAGERYYASHTIDYTHIVRFHVACAENYAEHVTFAGAAQ